MRFLLMFILLGFPLLDIASIVLAAQRFGWWTLVWLVAAAFAGISLIRQERFALMGRIMSSMAAGANPFSALFDSSRVLLAGLLLLFPGFLSDIAAVILLLIPRSARPSPQPRDDGIIEGEYRRED